MRSHLFFINLCSISFLMFNISSCGYFSNQPTFPEPDAEQKISTPATAHATNQVITPPATDPFLEPVIISAETIEEVTPEDIAKALFSERLDFYITDTDDPDRRLAEYRVEKVEIPDQWQHCNSVLQTDYIASIVYSVKPVAYTPHRWVAGSGTYETDNWVINKIINVGIRKEGNSYQMQILGVPPC